jgi:hypothetical protein
LLAPRPCWPWRSPHLRVVLKLRKDLGQDINHELVLGGDPLLDATIDLVERGRRRVELALARLRLRLGLHALPALKRVFGVRRDPSA